MITLILCVLIVALGLAVGYRTQIVEWFQGGAPQIAVKPENRGMRRHSIAYQLDPVRAADSVLVMRAPTQAQPHRWRLARTDGIAAVWSS